MWSPNQQPFELESDVKTLFEDESPSDKEKIQEGTVGNYDSDTTSGMGFEEAEAAETFNVITQIQTAWNCDGAVKPHDTEFFYWKNGTIIDSSPSLNFPKVPVGYGRKSTMLTKENLKTV